MSLRKFTTKTFPKIFICAIIAVACCFPAFSQTFPQGATGGRTNMTGEVTGVDVPNISVDIRNPETGQEVAGKQQTTAIMAQIKILGNVFVVNLRSNIIFLRHFSCI